MTKRPGPSRRVRWVHKSWIGRFLFEFVVVVAGVLVALALNAWLQDRQDAKSEAGYLALLSRDLDRTITDLEEFVAFEKRQLDDGVLAQRSIARVPIQDDTERVSEALAHLLTRQTMVLRNSTYLDLVNTGHLSLIRDDALRDEIVDFHQVTNQRFDVINRNNTYFVDDVYNTNVIFSGLIQFRLNSNHPAVEVDVASMAEKLGSDFVIPKDRLWSLPPEAPEWAIVRSSLMGRMLVSTLAISVSEERLQAARKLKASIDGTLAD
jgi:hypothetical protein